MEIKQHTFKQPVNQRRNYKVNKISWEIQMQMKKIESCQNKGLSKAMLREKFIAVNTKNNKQKQEENFKSIT